MSNKHTPSSLDSFAKAIQIFFPKKEEISVILDIGSLHGLEAIEMTKLYPNVNVFSFEANPVSFEQCLVNTQNYNRVKVFNLTINDYDGICDFYPINSEKTITTWFDGNLGASSMYKSNGVYDSIEKYVQDKIETPCFRIDTWAKQNSIQSVDAIWMDLQGAELKALRGMGDLLKTVKVIHTEMEINPMYEGQDTFSSIHPFLVEQGFSLLECSNPYARFGTDFVYIRG